MRLTVEPGLPWDVEADVLAITVPAGPAVPEYLAEVDRRLGGAITELRSVGALEGKLWDARLLPATDMAARFVLLMGTGDGSAIDRLGARRLGTVMVKGLAGLDVATLAVHVPETLVGQGGTSLADVLEALTRGLVEGTADPKAIYTEPEDATPELESVSFVVEGAGNGDLVSRAERGRVIGEGVNRTRRLSHRAANDVSPEVLADEASDLAKAHDLELTIFGPDEAEKLGMGMFLSVGRGSSNPPRFIALRSRPAFEKDASGRLLALVGKGVTFDTGGISLKPPPRMHEMKTDKTGACTVINAIATVALLDPELPLLAVAPAVENMPGPHSTRPGDVIRAMNGKTVQVDNTDAEGRLILGDALTWAERQGATHIADLATLTGSMARALGRYMTGGFATDDAWWAQIASAAALQGEPLWRLPLIEELRKELDSPFADMSNIGAGPEGGSITAALFLREFTDLPLAHLDIAGTAYLSKTDPYSTKGATGVMHATLVELALAGGSGAA